MADNSLVTTAAGNETFANKDIAGVKFSKVILYNSTGNEVVASALGQTTAAASASVVLASDQSTIPAKIAVSPVLNGATPSRINAAATTNATLLKASSGQLYTIDVFNVAAYNVFLKLYNKASAPTLALAAPVNGALTATAGGTLAATTYYVQSTWVNANGETLPSTVETSLAVAVNNVLNVAAPASPPATATGWNVYISTATGTETKQNASPIGLTTAFVEPTTGLIAGAAKPTVNTTFDTPIITIPVQAGGGYSKTWPMGLPFSTGIAYAITKLQADGDATVLAAGDLTGNTLWI